MTGYSFKLSLSALGTLGLLFAANAFSQSSDSLEGEPIGARRKIVLKILVAHARQAPLAQPQPRPQIDAPCADLHRRLKRYMPNLRRLNLVSNRSYQLAFGEQATMKLPSGREIRILPISIVRRRLHMQFEMPGVVNTRLQLKNHRAIILGGHKYNDGHLVVQVLPEFADAIAEGESDSTPPYGYPTPTLAPVRATGSAQSR